VKREPKAFHIENTYSSGKKNANSSVSGNHIRTATSLLVVNMVAFMGRGFTGLAKHGKCLTEGL
jgi:hypothetical protein